jgi:hypothetical protein
VAAAYEARCAEDSLMCDTSKPLNLLKAASMRRRSLSRRLRHSSSGRLPGMLPASCKPPARGSGQPSQPPYQSDCRLAPVTLPPGRLRLATRHLVGAQQDRWGHRKTERLGGLQVDDELELVGWITGRSAGFSPLRMRPVYVPTCRNISMVSGSGAKNSDAREIGARTIKACHQAKLDRSIGQYENDWYGRLW